MPVLYHLDDEARAELLCYLVTSQLASRTLTGSWLSVDHRLESAFMWLNGSGRNCGWLERARLAEMSVRLAARIVASGEVPSRQTPMLFTTLCQLDYRVPLVRTLHTLCEQWLANGHGSD